MGDTEPTTSSTENRSDPFEWRSLDDDRRSGPTREPNRYDRLRGLARPAIGTVFVSLLAILLIGVVPQGAVAHTAFTAGDVSMTTNSGRVTSLTIAPEGDVHYNGLEAVPSSIDVVVSTRLNSSSSWETVGSQSLAGDGLEGAVNYSFAEIDLLSATSMKSSDFAASDGTTSSTDVDVRVEVRLVGAGPGGNNVTATSMDTMAVTVTNEQAGAGVGGTANSGGSGA